MPPKSVARRVVQQQRQPVDSSLPNGPSLILDGQTQEFNSTQFQQQPVAPQRQILVSEEVMAEAMKLANDGKVTAKNAWDVKLIEGMQTSITNIMRTPTGASGVNASHHPVGHLPQEGNNMDLSTEGAGNSDPYAQFSKAANLVEGGAKVWSHRVDNTCESVKRMVLQMYRTDGKAEAAQNEAGREGEEGEAGGEATQQNRQKKKKVTVRTVAETIEEINMTDKVKADKGHEAINALQRALTEKFDQSHSVGCLFNNANGGPSGNLITCVDEAKEPTTNKRNNRRSKNMKVEPQQQPAHYGLDNIDPQELVDINLPILSPDDPSSPHRTRQSQDDSKIGRLSQQQFAQDLTNCAGKAQLLPFVPKAEPLDQDGTASVVGRQSNAASVFGKVDHEAPSVVGQGDWEGNDDDFIGDHFDDDPDGNDDEGPGGYDPEYVGNAEMDVRSVAATARSMLNPNHDLQEWDKMALEAEDPNGDWVPLTAKSSSHFPLQRTALSSFRKQALLPKLNPQSQAADGSFSAAQPPAKKKRGEKSVKFQGEVATVEATVLQEDLDQLKLNRTDTAAVLPKRRNFNVSLFSDVTKCHDMSLKTRGVVSSVDFQSIKSMRSRESVNALSMKEMQKVLCPWPDQAETIHSTVTFFQPTCCAEPKWNVLRKTFRHSQAAMGALRHIMRGSRGDEQGDEEAVEQIYAELPADVFDGDGDQGGLDDYNDGPEDNDVGMDPFADWVDMGLPNQGENKNGLEEEEEDEADAEKIRLIDAPQMVTVLQVHHATMPTEVDVVRLRETMWDTTQKIQKMPNRRLSWHDHEGTPRGEDLNQCQFTDVMVNMAPKMNRITKTGKLSPAFFFFSLLFLANEHGLELTSENLSDITIRNAPKLEESAVAC